MCATMSFTVAVHNSPIRFPCEPNESVLDAARRAGYEIPYSCRKGVCGTCKGRIVTGEVRAFAGDAEPLPAMCCLPPAANLATAPRGVALDACPPVFEYTSVSRTRMFTFRPLPSTWSRPPAPMS